MKKRNLFRVICCLLAILLLLAAGSTQTIFAEENDTVKEARKLIDGILAQKGDAFLIETAGVGGEWYVIALRQYGKTDFAGYEQALLTYLDKTEVYSATSRQKYALALLAAGSEDEYIQNTVNDSMGQQGIMSWVFGLHLLNNGCVSTDYTVGDVKNTILSLQLEDGGWAITGTVSDVDVTAMTVQALAPYYEEQTVKNAIDKALSLLSTRQLEDGDYASYGVSNPESTAQVLIALSALGIDCKEDSRFIKNGKTLFDGMEKYALAADSYSHQLGGTHNEMATAQVFCAMVAYIRMLNGESGLYQFDTKTMVIVPVSKEDAPISLKVWICLAIVAAGIVACGVLFFLKKRNLKQFIAVLLVVTLGIGVVLLTDVQTAEDYYNSQPTEKPEAIGKVTLSIRCDTVPEENRVILDTTEFSIAQGDTVFTILTEAARKHGIHLEYSGTETMAYIKGIDHLYELQYGDLSGWVYHVNGESPSVGCGEYEVTDGDTIIWHYSCDLGKDIQ